MANSWFRFQQFEIQQGRSAMKVCSDSCLFGAYVASKLNSNHQTILDVGAGTGLLSQMLAQKSPASKLHCIEPDMDSFLDLQHNISASPWKNRIEVYAETLSQWMPGRDDAYDVVICNPPFFFDHLNLLKLKKYQTSFFPFSE